VQYDIFFKQNALKNYSTEILRVIICAKLIEHLCN